MKLKNRNLQESDLVRVVRPITALDLPRGRQGTIVHVYANTKEFQVEFKGKDEHIWVTHILKHNQIESVNA